MSKANEQSMIRVELDSTGALRVVANLSKREYFAAIAMQGVCANSIPGEHHMSKNVARDSVAYAEALIAELEKGGGE